MKKTNEDKEIKNDFDVLCQIYEDTVVNNDVAYFTKLVKETGYSSKAVSNNLDQLYNFGIVYIKYQKTDDGRRACFVIEDNSMALAKDKYEQKQEELDNSANLPK